MALRSRAALAGALIAALVSVFLASSPAQALPVPVSSYTTLTTFTGTNSVDLPNAAAVAALEQGTIVSRFRTTSASTPKTLLSASDSTRPSTNLTLAVNGENLHYEARDAAGADLTRLDWPLPQDRAGRLNDGRWHTAVTTVGATGTRIYVDGYLVHSGTSTAFFADVPNANALKIGINVDSGGPQWGFVGDIAETHVYGAVLSDTEIRDLYPAPDTAVKWTPDTTYDPSTPLANKLPSSGGYGSAAEGTIFAYFRSGGSGVQAILSAANTAHASTNLTIALQGGNLYYEHRTNGAYAAQLTVPGHWNDGQWHSVALRVNDRGTVLYADGAEIGRHASTAFMSSLTGVNGLWLGGNVDSTGQEWMFTGQIGRVKLFDWSLTESGVKHLAGQVPLPTQALFDPGYAGSSNYRIPSLIRTTAGTLIAGADQRKSAAQDAPNDINFAIRRSFDNGQTWTPAQVLLDYPGSGVDGASVIDSVLVQNADTGRVFVVIDRFPGGGGQANAGLGTGFDATGRKLLFAPGGAEYRMNADGSVVTPAGGATTFHVAADGDVTQGGAPAGNIHTKPGLDPAQALYEYNTAYLTMIRSDDDGVTWSAPVDITTQVKEPWMRFIGTGPGNGIQLQHGPHAGRILVPIYFNNATSPANVYSSAVVYSDDNGLTWHRSESPNDGRVYNGQTLSAQTLTDVNASTHEATLIERANGDVLMLMRNLTPGQRVVTSASSDGGLSWGPRRPGSGAP